jgi:hypothetical protein
MLHARLVTFWVSLVVAENAGCAIAKDVPYAAALAPHDQLHQQTRHEANDQC